MATKGLKLTNPNSGDVYEFIETSAETNGKHLLLKVTLKAKGEYVPNHIHVLQDETFTVLKGKLTYMINGKKMVLNEGESISLPKGIAHNHYNGDDEPVEIYHKVEPALDFELIIENLIGLSKDGKLKNGKAGLLQELVTLRYLDSKAFLSDMPLGAQKFLMKTVAPIARAFGYRASYKKYAGVEK
jgi:quercetin dioxygenase-like cupin family protein